MAEMRNTSLTKTILNHVPHQKYCDVINDLASSLSEAQVDKYGFSIAETLAEIVHICDSEASETHENEYRSAVTLGEHVLLEFLCRAICEENAHANMNCIHLVVQFFIQNKHTPLLKNLVEVTFCCLSEEIRKQMKEPQDYCLRYMKFRILIEKFKPVDLDFRIKLHNNKAGYIIFLKFLFLSTPNLSFAPLGMQVIEDAFSLALLLVGCSPELLSSQAASMICTMIKHPDFKDITWSLDRGDPESQSYPVDFIWERISEVIRESEQFSNAYATRGLTIWLQLLSLPAESFPLASFLESDFYWELLQARLSFGTSEQRKICLTIAYQSLNLCQSNFSNHYIHFFVESRELYLVQYSKFRILFETIVLGRYLNQVQSSLGDLSSLASRNSSFDKSWILCLLDATLNGMMQDSVRKIIGSWSFDYVPQLLAECSHLAPKFLQQSFLLWATEGYHFTSSLNTLSSEIIVCTHGEKLVSCLDHLLRSLTKPEEKVQIIKAVLRFIDQRGPRIFSFSRAFLLEAVVKGVKASQVPLDKNDVDMAINLSNATGSPVIVQNFMTAMFVQLLEMSRTDFPDERAPTHHEIDETLYDSGDEGEKILCELAQKHISERKEQTDNILDINQENQRTVQQLAYLIEVSRHRCLWGHGLLASCKFLLLALQESSNVEVNESQLKTVFEAMWDETEIQDYPREVIMKFPTLLFHPKVVNFCMPESILLRSVSEITIKLQLLGENRIYAFGSFAKEFHRTCLSIQEAINLPIEDVLVRFMKHPPSPKVEFQLETAFATKLQAIEPMKTYHSFYGEPKRYGYACMFDILNRLPNTPQWVELGKNILNRLLSKWIGQKQPVSVSSRWKTSAQLQAMLLLSEHVLSPLDPGTNIDEYSGKFIEILSMEPLPRFRYLLEWIIGRIYVRFASRRWDLLKLQQQLDISNPKHIVSFLKITSMLVKLSDNDENFAFEVMGQLIPFAASAKVAIRHEAQWIFPSLYDHARARSWSRIIKDHAFSRLNDHIRNLESYRNPPQGRMQEGLDLMRDHTLTNLFQGGYLRIEPSEADTTTRDDFLTLWESCATYDIPSFNVNQVTSLPLGERRGTAQSQAPGEASTSQVLKIDKDQELFGRLQTKALTLQTELLSAHDIDEFVKDRPSRDVIIVASLIDSPYNLGGLSRACEIFGVKSMQVNKLDVLKSKDFSSVAVSSHMWLPIEQLEVDDIPNFITRHRLEGYTIVGIEQTDSSKVLGRDNWDIPDKTLLVLGSEREGIPANILAEMDVCVEIRQQGFTRSMNVQTAAAVVLYEMFRQQQ